MKVAACAAALVLAITAGCTNDDPGPAPTSTAAPTSASATVVSGATAQLLTRLGCSSPVGLPATTVGAKPVADIGCTAAGGPLEVVTFTSTAEVDRFLVALRKYMSSGETVVVVKGTSWVVSYKAPDDTDLANAAVTARYRTAASRARAAVGGEIVTLRG